MNWPDYLDDGRRRVDPIGPTPCPVLFLGESPGREEDEQGAPFVGKTGQACDVLWERAGFRRGFDFRLANVAAYLPADYDEGITAAEVARDRPLLLRHFAEADPAWCFAMGGWVARAVLDEYLTGLGFDFDMDWAWGVAFRVPRPDDASKSMIVIPAPHPAAGLRDPAQAARFWLALERFGKAYWGETGLAVWSPESSDVEYTEGEVPQRFSPVGLDTESRADGTMLCATYSRGERSGVWVDAADASWPDALRVVMHNGAHDENVLRSAGIDVGEYDDTMIAARILGEPGGLKALCIRHFGMPMRDYDDVVGPYKRAKWASYLKAAVAEAGKRSSWSIRQGTSWSLAMRIKAAKNARLKAVLVDEPFDVEARFTSETLTERDRRRLEAACGPYPTADLTDVPAEERIPYACRDADGTRRLAPLFDRRLKETDSRAAYNIDMGVVPVLARIRRVGMKVDREPLRALELEMEGAITDLDRTMHELVGREFNPASTPEIARILFDEWGQPVTKFTKGTGQASTEAKQLEQMRNRLLGRKAEHGGLEGVEAKVLAFLDALVERRHVDKLKGTNVEPVWRFIDANDYIHPDLRMDAASGRCVSGGKDAAGREQYNALAVPKHSPWAGKIRKCYPAGAGRKYVVVDLSQIEMRVLAHQSADPVMADIFEHKRDMHSETAVFIFNERSGLYPDLDLASTKATIPTSMGKGVTFRQASKTLGFLMVFLGTEWGGQEQLAKMGLLEQRETVREWIDAWLTKFPRVKPYWEETWEKCRGRLYSSTRAGRRRYLPWLVSPHERDRRESERQAISQEIQGGAIEQAKIWIRLVANSLDRWRDRGYYVEIVMWTHDDIAMVVDAEIAEDVAAFVKQAAKEAIQLRVPVEADSAIGDTWGEAK